MYLKSILSNPDFPKRSREWVEKYGVAIDENTSQKREVRANWSDLPENLKILFPGKKGYTAFWFDKDRNPGQEFPPHLIVKGFAEE